MDRLVTCAWIIASLALAALLSAPLPGTLRSPPPTDLTQNITVGYLERLLVDLKTSGQEPATATICTVNWAKYGVVVRLNCKTRLRAGSPSKTPVVPLKQNRLHDAANDANPDPDATTPGDTPSPYVLLDGEARIDCDSRYVEDPVACTTRELDLYNANLAAPWAVTASGVCDAILAVMHHKFESPRPTCPVSSDFSELKLMQSDETAGRRTGSSEPYLYILVSKDASEPPVFSVSVVGTPAALDNMTSTEHFERIDFLLFWTYERNGEFDVAVEPVFILQGTNRSSINELIQVKTSERMSSRVAGIRQTQARPTVVASAIASSVRELTEVLRDSMDLDF